MNIVVDLRSLHSKEYSGVENYIINVLEHLIPLDRSNTYTLFYTGFSRRSFGQLHFVNSRLVARRIPNRLLNLSLKLTRQPTFERLVGDFDLLFLPNLNQFSISPKTKLAVTVHDLSPFVFPELYNFKGRLWHKLLNVRRTLERATVICPVSQFTKDEIVRLFEIPSEKIRVVHPGIDHKLFHPDLAVEQLRDVRNRYNLPGDFILFLNTIEPRKNLSGVISAMERLPRPTHLVIAGKRGWKYRSILDSIERSPRARYISYLDYVSAADKPFIMKLARALIYPSFYEGFGFQPLEAMALAVPVIASQVASLPEVLSQAALLVNPHDSSDLARAIEDVLGDDELREKLIQRGLERAKQFSWERTAKDFKAVLDYAYRL